MMIDYQKMKIIIKFVMTIKKILFVFLISAYLVQADNCPTAQYWQFVNK